MSTTETIDRAVPERHALPLPATTAGLMAMRSAKGKRSILDYVEDAHIALWENDDYRNLCDAVMNTEAVEGSLAANHYRAAELIRDKARKSGSTNPAGTANLETLKRSLRLVMRRYQISPAQRRAGFVNGEALAAIADDTDADDTD